MDEYIIIPLYLNCERFIKEKTRNFSKKDLFSEIKILMLRTNRLLTPVYHFPSIKTEQKYNLKESVNESIEKLIGSSTQSILKITEFNVYNINDDRIKHKAMLSMEIIFMATDEMKHRSHPCDLNPEFISILETTKIAMSDQSKEYAFHLTKWMEKECMTANSLYKWFSSSYNKDISIIGYEFVESFRNKEIKQKSTSLDTINNYKIPRPQSSNNALLSKKQADSLDQLTQKLDKKLITSTGGPKISLKSKLSKTKPVSSSGPVTAMPISESKYENLVIKNPLLYRPMTYQWQSDIVIHNLFWNKKKPDFKQIKKKAKSLFPGDENICRNRCWKIDYPLHFASYIGDLVLISSLIDKGYNCALKDHVGWTPIHYAAWYGHKDVVTLFIQYNTISVNTRTTDLLTPIHICVYRKYSDIAEILLKQPDIDMTLTTCTGEDSRILAERLSQQSIITLLKTITPKPTKLPVHLMDNSVRHLVLTKGMDTTFQHLKVQMIDMLNISSNCVDVFNFWISCKSTKLSGKNSIIPIQCFSDTTLTIKELNLDDFKLYWKRNIFLSLEIERRVKDITVISLLFEEAVQNFTTKSLYPCDSKDVILLCSVLLYLHLPSDTEKPVKSNRRALSLSRIHRPLSFMFSSNPDVSSQHVSSSMHVTRDLTLPNTKTVENKSVDKSLIMEVRRRQAKSFLSNEKNLSQITPKRKTKNSKINLSEEILNQFMSSSFSHKIFSSQDVKFRFLTLCWNLTLYGCAYFDVEIKLQSFLPYINCIYAVNDMGIYIMHSKTNTLIQNFKYSSVSWNIKDESKCLVLTTRKNDIFIKSKYIKMIAQVMLTLHTMNPM